MTPSLFQRIQSIARLLDEEALCALANRGLYKRAQKDIEIATPTLVAETSQKNQAVEIQVENCKVLLFEQPQQCKCSCAANAICRHILAAWMFLAKQPLDQTQAPIEPTSKHRLEKLEQKPAHPNTQKAPTPSENLITEAQPEGQQLYKKINNENTSHSIPSTEQKPSSPSSFTSKSKPQPKKPKQTEETKGEKSKNHSPPKASLPVLKTAGQEILALSEGELKKWAGSNLWKRTQQEFLSGLQIEYKDGTVWIAKIVDWNLEVRFFQGAGLLGMLCGCHKKTCCLHRILVIFAWRVHHGLQSPSSTYKQLQASTEAPRTVNEIRKAAMNVVEQIVTHGLSRLSPKMTMRLKTLATSAHGVDLPRLERMLQGLADEMTSWLNRTALASETALLMRCSTIYLLAEALENPASHLVGLHRQSFEKVNHLELLGLGAKTWKSASGYQGLTLYFWETSSQTFHTFTEARPENISTFSPVARFAAPGPWPGCESYSVASRSHIRLQTAWRSRTGRLSAKESTTVLLQGPIQMDALPPAIDDWQMLSPLAKKAFFQGLSVSDPRAAYVLLHPHSMMPAFFDPILQQLRRPIYDKKGNSLFLVLPQSPEHQKALQDLETLQVHSEFLVFGLLQIRKGELLVEPVSFIEPGSVFSLGLDSTPSKATQQKAKQLDDNQSTHSVTVNNSLLSNGSQESQDKQQDKMAHSESLSEPMLESDSALELENGSDVLETDSLAVEEIDLFAHPPHPISQLLLDVWTELEKVAALGISAYQHWNRFEIYANHAEIFQLTHVKQVLQALAKPHAMSKSPIKNVAWIRSQTFLKATWILHLSQLAFSLQAAL